MTAHVRYMASPLAEGHDGGMRYRGLVGLLLLSALAGCGHHHVAALASPSPFPTRTLSSSPSPSAILSTNDYPVCAPSQLRGSFGGGGGVADYIVFHMDLTNVGHDTCSLPGKPGKIFGVTSNGTRETLSAGLIDAGDSYGYVGDSPPIAAPGANIVTAITASNDCTSPDGKFLPARNYARVAMTLPSGQVVIFTSTHGISASDEFSLPGQCGIGITTFQGEIQGD